ncbi:hypothetical protein KR093_009992 [Drosophila rubida]|uniref:Uncharacterized protein n=1 Tax=Drosophila rubida TaxID=30044 RepID=A0AAD4PKV6_9MUSC|nr:hypothetical protein KR093_009992 [Drosophila rubida]
MQKQEKRRELRLKRFWRSPKTTSSDDSTGYESPTRTKPASSDAHRFNHLHYTSLSQGSGTTSSSAAAAAAGGAANGGATASTSSKPSCSLPLLQVWPSQDSPRGEADGQSFVFPAIVETSVGSTHAPSTSGGNGNGSQQQNDSNGSSHNLTATRRSNNHLTLSTERRSSLYCDTLHAGDSGIDSVQASPSPNAFIAPPCGILGLPHGQTGGGSCHVSPTSTPTQGSPNLSLGRRHMRNSICVVPSGSAANNYRRKSSALLHPDHARLFALRMKHAAALERAQTSPDQTSIEDANEFHDNGLATNMRLCSASSSTTSSLTSVAAVSLGGGVAAAGAGAGISLGLGLGLGCGSSGGIATASSGACSSSAYAVGAGAGAQQRVSDPWLQPQSDRDSRHGGGGHHHHHHHNHHQHDGRRRSSTMTARYSLFDALDLEYVLLRAAARGSVGPYSLSESIHKLTFTQSLAFPALARGLATKRRRSATHTSSRPLNPHESGLNTCAKVVTAVVLVAISFMVFLIVYKFVRT